MRVIAGQYRSRQLRTLAGIKLRPTSDRLRETLFNVLASGAMPLEGSTWLDLFAGSGAIGIEALSRGAAMVYFVEQSRSVAAIVRENLQSLAITTGFEVVERDATEAVRQLSAHGVVCDFVFLDPPYADAAAYHSTLSALAQTTLLKPGSIVVAEHEKHFDPEEQFGPLQRYRKLQQGDAVLSFYRLAM